MPLTREQIVRKELDYFKSDLALEPAFISGGYHDEEDGYREDACVYKTEDGRKCAVGALIKPAHYDPEFDAGSGTPVTRLPDEVIDYLGPENIEWLSKLQSCHDDCARSWESGRSFGDYDHFGRFFLKVAKNQALL